MDAALIAPRAYFGCVQPTSQSSYGSFSFGLRPVSSSMRARQKRLRMHRRRHSVSPSGTRPRRNGRTKATGASPDKPAGGGPACVHHSGRRETPRRVSEVQGRSTLSQSLRRLGAPVDSARERREREHIKALGGLRTPGRRMTRYCMFADVMSSEPLGSKLGYRAASMSSQVQNNANTSDRASPHPVPRGVCGDLSL